MVENDVTSKLEGVLSTLKGIKKIKSTSRDGGGWINLDIDPAYDIHRARFEASSLIRQTYNKLPAKVSYPIVSVDQIGEYGSKLLMSYTIDGVGTAADIQGYTEKNIIPALAKIDGLTDIQAWGARRKVWQLYYKPRELSRYNLSQDEISHAVSEYFSEYEPGAVAFNPWSGRASEVRFLRLDMKRDEIMDWNRIPLKRIGNRTVFLTDVITPKLEEELPGSIYRINGNNTVNLTVSAIPGGNVIALAEKVKASINAISMDQSQAYHILANYDASTFLKKELTKLFLKTLGTLLLLFLFVLIISRRWRYVLLIFISLTCNLLLGAVLFFVFKIELNLYSFAGITISMGMIIDNSIVVIDHVRHKNNLKVFLAVAGSTLTTIGAVSIIFMLDKAQQQKLLDFAWVMIINLTVSLFIALFLIPALLEKLPLQKNKGSILIRSKRRIIKFNRLYSATIRLCFRFRKLCFVLVVFAFGIPLFMLPAKIEKDNRWAQLYNATIGSEWYSENVRGWLDPATGGSLRLFLTQSDQFQYVDNENEQTRLSVNIKMPQGANIEQMDAIVQDYEAFLKQFDYVSQFECRINSGQQAQIEIWFKEAEETGSKPFMLKSELESKAVYTGLADFQISGVGQGFNNSVNTETTNSAIVLQGFNYDQLLAFAEQTKKLLKENPRVEKVNINSERDWTGEKSSYEFLFSIRNKEDLLNKGLTARKINSGWAEVTGRRNYVTGITTAGNYVSVYTKPLANTVDKWQVLNSPIRTDSGAYVRLDNLAFIEKQKTGSQIVREDQQYQLVVNYNFIGDVYLSKLVSDRIIKQLKEQLPVGYSVKEERGNFWDGSAKSLTWAVIYTIGIVFLVCAVLLNSVKQSLIVISVVPVSFIGVFLISWWVGYRFDEGGYASFIVLSGVVVNAALYFLNDYNNLLHEKKQRSTWKLFLKSYNSKIIPVLLSTASMVLGLVPFIIYSQNEPFWYALAVSTIGGLLFSMIAVLIFVPLLLAKPVGRVKESRLRKIFTLKRISTHG